MSIKVSESSGTREGSTFQRVILALTVLVSLVILAPRVGNAFYPPQESYLDFVQEWLSARNYWNNHPIYESQLLSMERYTGIRFSPSEAAYLWNAHSPVSVLAALPFGLCSDYHLAHFIWNLLSLLLLLGSGWLILRELQLRLSIELILAVILLALWSYPLYSHFSHGQLNIVLLILLTLGWWADRNGYPVLAGLSIGTATAMKLFPGVLLIYLLFGRRWMSLLIAIAAILALNGFAILLFGSEALRVYLTEVLPSVRSFELSLTNYSLSGLFSRLGRETHLPQLFKLLALSSQLLILTILGWKSWQSREQQGRDAAYCLTLVAMPLLSPVSWAHYLVLLVLPWMWLWIRATQPWARLSLFSLVILLNLPSYVVPQLLLGMKPPATFQASLVAPERYYVCAEPFTMALGLLFLGISFTQLKRFPDSSS